MNFILFSIGALGGGIISSFTLIPVLIIIRFGIPYTKHLERTKSLLINNHIVRGYIISILLLGGIYTLAYWGSTLLPQILYFGYVFGSIWSLVLGISKTGANSQNMSDYKEANKEKFV